MTRIYEMEDFFDFEEAATTGWTMEHRQRASNSIPASSSSFDIDQILAQAADPDYSFNFSQPYELDPFTNALPYRNSHVVEERTSQLANLSPFSGQIGGALRSSKQCEHCRAHNLECYVAGDQYGACTSCHALSRRCNLATGGSTESLESMGSLASYLSVPPNRPDKYADSGGSDVFATKTVFQHTSASKNPGLSQINMRDDISEGSSKSVARFSRETVRLLRDWVSIHHLHPYPTEEEKEDLTRRTGLTKIQVTNWLANARRRGQVKSPRAKSPSSYKSSKPISVPRQPTQVPKQMDPMERWKISPTEHEPALITDIARAAKVSPVVSFKDISPGSYPHSEAGSAHSVASSRHTSRSSHASFTSSHSRQSRGSFGSFGRKGRRRRRPVSKAANIPSAVMPRQYQCTFCIETFKTKHDWQRHEKSLHLSLERWICAYNVNNNTGNSQKCAFCGIPNTDTAHYEGHNYTVCQERSLEERTFYRKDHLRQHLRLVHDCQFLASTMDSWKIAAPRVRSRCGFCGLSMDTWAARTDHIAEHFKSGKTMADWQGSWGFDLEIQKLVEDGIPPYLINSKRISVMTREPPLQINGDVPTPYDLIKSSLLDFATKQTAVGRDVTNEDFRAEASRVLSEFSQKHESTYSSWFLDLIMCPDDTLWLDSLRDKAAVKSGNKPQINRNSKQVYNIDEKDSVERYCEFERQLIYYVDAQRALGLTPTDEELRMAGCRIIMEYDKRYSKVPSARSAAWFCDQIMSSHSWTAQFRQRNSLPPSTDIRNERHSPEGSHSPVHSYQTLEERLADFVNIQIGAGITPSDTDLQRQARLITYDVDDPFLQTVADNALWLARFKSIYKLADIDPSQNSTMHGSPGHLLLSHLTTMSRDSVPSSSSLQSTTIYQAEHMNIQSELGDWKEYQHLESELSRFTSAFMSHHSHIPTDEQIRRHARYAVYKSDDPQNLTLADSEDWLLNFKRSAGLVLHANRRSEPKISNEVPLQLNSMHHMPPHIGSDQLLATIPALSHGSASQMDNGFFSAVWPSINAETGSNYVAPSLYGSAGSNFIPGTNSLFCLGLIESHLADYVCHSLNQGIVPSDEQLRTQVRAMGGMSATAADDSMLLKKFKEFYFVRYGFSLPNEGNNTGSQEHISASNLLNNREDGDRLTAHWKPARARSKAKGYNKLTGNKERIDHSRRVNSTASSGRTAPSVSPVFATTGVDDSQNCIDPQMWGAREFVTRLESPQIDHGNDDIMME